MSYSYYTIDDLRLRYAPKSGAGWRLSQFLSLSDALEHYHSLPDDGVKSIGLTDGFHVLELARHFPPPHDGIKGVDALAADYRAFPFWREVEEAAAATDACISALNISCLLINEQPVSMSSVYH